MRSHVYRVASLVSCLLVIGCAEETFVSPSAPDGLTQQSLLEASLAYSQGDGVTDEQTVALLDWYDIWMESPEISSPAHAVRQAFEEEITVRGIGWEDLTISELNVLNHPDWAQFEAETSHLFYSMPRGASPGSTSGGSPSTGAAAFIGPLAWAAGVAACVAGYHSTADQVRNTCIRAYGASQWDFHCEEAVHRLNAAICSATCGLSPRLVGYQNCCMAQGPIQPRPRPRPQVMAIE